MKTDFERHSYDNVASIVDPEIVNELVVQVYGSRIQPEEYDFNDDTEDGLRTANQFVYIHRHVKKEKEGAGARQDQSGEAQ